MVSNNILAGLLIVAIVIGIAGVGMNLAAPRLAVPGAPLIITGQIPGVTNVTVAAQVLISLPVSAVDFGSLYIGNISNTTDFIPSPFLVQNDGSVDVNITIEATDLWSTVANPSGNYSFNTTENETGTVLNATYDLPGPAVINMPASGSPTMLANCTGFELATDALNVDIFLQVPSDEPAGDKGSTVTFTATQAASGNQCS